MCMNLTTNLLKLGFNSNKSKIYLSVLSLGTATVSEIARKAGIVRTTVYKILDELIQDGLLEQAKIGKVKKFVALNPNKLVDLLENKKSATEAMLPELLGLFVNSEFRPKLKFYEGEAGMKTVFEDIFCLHDDVVYTFSPIHEVLSRFGETYSRHFLERRAKNKIKRLALRPASAKSSATKDWEFYGSDKDLWREVRFLPPEINCDTLIQIYDNKVGVIASEKEDYAFIVESKELADLMKSVFKWLWMMSKEQKV